MSGESGSDQKRSSMELFDPPTTSKGSLPGAPTSDDKSKDDGSNQSYLEERIQRHKEYLMVAKQSQRTIDSLRKQQELKDK
ncbi:MAG: hypothetical protein P8N43_06935 [Alphaproteobacteria bacterium]|nr:hypothetical protein [Alphaproteobacteria bacterium]